MRIALIIGTATLLSIGCASKKKDGAAPAPAPAPAAKASDQKAGKAEDKKEAAKPAASASTGAKVECKLGGETRTMEVRAKDGGCETVYTKFGQENVVGSSMNGTAHCEGLVERIKTNLSNAGFSCN